METDQKTPGQVLYEAYWQRNDAARWGILLAAGHAVWENVAAAVLAHDRANQPAASGVTDTQRLDWVLAQGWVHIDRDGIDRYLTAAPEAPKP
jgi:hypothetical protein